MNKFKPAFGLSNSHLQTIYSSLFRKLPLVKFTKKKFLLSDGDFLDIYWSKIDKHKKRTPIVILFHGLAGNSESPYIQGAMHTLNSIGFSTVLMHFRGCSGVDNLLARSYHSGETGDAIEFINSIKKEYPESKIFATGYSLGANMLLKLLSEEKSLLDAAVAVSSPMQLDICANRMNKGLSRYYQYRLVKDLNTALLRKFEKHNLEKLIGLKKQDILKLKSFWDFDEAYTAPIHGFKSAQDYYTQCSSKQFLKEITTPTLIIHAKDDPFMTPEVIPSMDELSSSITLELSENGGHVGFIGGSLLKPNYWLEERISLYFREKLLT